MSVRLLLVSQDRDARESIASAFGAKPQVLFTDCAENGREALARIAARRPDVLVVGLPLADLGAIDFVRAAKRTHASCQILLVAAPGTEEELVAAIEAGAAGCVIEPCEPEDLITHALRLRSGGSPLSPLVARKVVERLHARTLPLATAVAALTARESDVVCLLADGLSYAEIGDRLGVSLNTVGSHIKSVYRKLDVHSATAAVMRAVELQGLDRASPCLASPDPGIVECGTSAQHGGDAWAIQREEDHDNRANSDRIHDRCGDRPLVVRRRRWR